MSIFNRVVHVIILITLAVAKVQTASRQMLCMDLEHRFEGRSHPRASSRIPNSEERMGDPVGSTRENGDTGIDFDLLKLQITEKLIEELQFDAKMAAINSTLMKINSTLMKMQQEIDNKGDVICRDVNGTFYHGKCYWLRLQSKQNVGFSRAEDLCAEGGGEPGDVVNRIHFMLIEGMAQSLTTFSTFARILTGMVYYPERRWLTTRGGSRILYQKWKIGYPTSTPIYTRVLLQIYREETSRSGLQNITPSYHGHGVLCQK